MSERKGPPRRNEFRVFRPLDLRWMDNDVFGHVNNATYYSLFDTTVCSHLLEQGVFHPTEGDVIAFVVESGCTYFSAVAFPEKIEGALAVERVGNSSVRYRPAVFRAGAEEASAAGHFTHVYVDRATRRPVPLPDDVRAVVEALL